jgi:SpoVK/Ycf46/Vps4 family AAA+-type ATPase
LKVSYDDVILDLATKDYVQQVVSLLNLRPESSSKQLQALMRTNGMLFYGPPGTGKTHLCRAIASSGEAKYHLISVSAAMLLSKWVGESEKYISALFSLARRLFPSIIFIDEADAMFFRRTSLDTAWQRASLNQILQEMDGIDSENSSRPRPMVIAATNRPLDLDEAFLRRLPHRVYFKLPLRVQRLQILAQYLHQGELSDEIRLMDLVDATHGYSGSDLANLCSQATLAWSSEQASLAGGKDAKEVKKAKVFLMPHHFRVALERSSATTSRSALEQFEKFATKFDPTPVASTQVRKMFGYRYGAQDDRDVDQDSTAH